MSDIENLNKWRLILDKFAGKNIKLKAKYSEKVKYSEMDNVLDFLFNYILGKLYEKHNKVFGIFLDSITDGRIQSLYFI